MRITVFKDGWRTNNDGKVILVESSWDDLLAQIKTVFGIKAAVLYNHHGGVVDQFALLRDDDVLYLSKGEPLQNPACQPSVCELCENRCVHPSPFSNGMKESESEWIKLNVGGQCFATTRTTLTRVDPESMLARMFSRESDWNNSKDESGAFLIDRSPVYFEPILNYLRHGKLVLDKFVNPEGVLEEARFFGIASLIEILEDMCERDLQPDDNTPITRRDLTLRLLSTSTNKELRCQGLNFTGANLSKLDLRHINFKYAILRNANLSGANLSYCNFERADLCKAKIDSAILLGVKMLCANLESTSMHGCYFEDPAGSRANMEGALMKNVDLEGSHMAGVNLRVATLKNANLQNCDLRGAVLAGADLENCDLTGCDLQEANLRGANLKGATFELMLHPLHMAQTVR